MTGDKFSVPGEIATADSNGTAYVDRLYFADTGGNIWRCDVGKKGWSGKKIFSLYRGAATDKGKRYFTGRLSPLKMRIKPEYMSALATVTSSRNTAVKDRMYALWDKNQTVAMTEAALMDVTANELQASTTTADRRAELLAALEAGYGWFIKLESTGEKALAVPQLYNQGVYFTTYAPLAAADAESCDAGNLGTATVYAVNYLTGEAVVNYYAGNDFTSTDAEGYISLYDQNNRATPNGLTPERWNSRNRDCAGEG